MTFTIPRANSPRANPGRPPRRAVLRTLAPGPARSAPTPARRPGRRPPPSGGGVALPRRASRDAGPRRGHPPSPRSLRGRARRGDGECPAPLLLLSLLLLSLGLPVLGAPPRLICDSRVLERYILEAREAENATMGCAEGCSFSENITVPDTKVNFHAWKRMEVQQQAVEVWQGLALLSEAILQGQALLANSSQPSEALQLHVDKAVSGLRSLTSLLRALGAQKEAVPLPDAASSAAPLRTFTIDTLCKLFRIYSNFLRGKLTLYTGEACRRGDR
ncbi:erythropoietin [Balaenoptera acutorostrata]|uniref:Erythropoietin n=1 Tax=Balaenoptera acutorostrata TaxID=9767 RepID=A0ABM3S4M5_BALAC|nr:erythropoietin [Balaenoptera acutorostrata]